MEFEFAKALGIPINPDKRPDNVSVTNFSGMEPNTSVLPIGGQDQVVQNSTQSNIAAPSSPVKETTEGKMR